jgi:hypothetical protein
MPLNTKIKQNVLSSNTREEGLCVRRAYIYKPSSFPTNRSL